MLGAPELPTGGVLVVTTALAPSVGENAPGVVTEEDESAVAGVAARPGGGDAVSVGACDEEEVESALAAGSSLGVLEWEFVLLEDFSFLTGLGPTLRDTMPDSRAARTA